MWYNTYRAILVIRMNVFHRRVKKPIGIIPNYLSTKPKAAFMKIPFDKEFARIIEHNKVKYISKDKQAAIRN